MPDQISVFRVARLSLYPPTNVRSGARYALIANRVKRGIPTANILLDGVVHGVDPSPTTEELLEAFDSALAQHMLHR